AITGLLDAHRLVSIVGTGGVGKTALAARLGEVQRGRNRRAVHQVELVALTDHHQVIPALVRALQVPVSQAPALEAVQAALRGAPRLLVLDNCEHLLPGIAAVIAGLMAEAPELSV